MISLRKKNRANLMLIAVMLAISSTQQAFFTTLDTNYKKATAAAIGIGAVSYGCYSYVLHNANKSLEQGESTLATITQSEHYNLQNLNEQFLSNNKNILVQFETDKNALKTIQKTLTKNINSMQLFTYT